MQREATRKATRKATREAVELKQTQDLTWHSMFRQDLRRV